MIGSSRRAFRDVVVRADAARDEGRFLEAAVLYREASRLVPGHAGVRVQRGNMLKDWGDLAGAEASYLEAKRLIPNDPDLAMQLGHLYKIGGRLKEAVASYERAILLQPGWEEPVREIEGLRKHGWRGVRSAADLHEFVPPAAEPAAGDYSAARSAAEVARLIPALAPRRYQDMLFRHHDHIEVRKLGRQEVGYWGKRRTLRGVEALHGFCISEVPIVELEVLLNGIAIHRAPMSGGYALTFEQDKERIKKYVYNVWIDFSLFAYGLHVIELRFLDADEETRSFHDDVVIAEPVTEGEYPESDGLVSVSHDDPRSVEQQIRERPSMVRSAKRALFPNGVRNVLVMRTDQLGDMVASIPAVQRLRELFPDARLVGLMTPANVEFANSLGLFDEVIGVDFPDDRLERRRLMSLDQQQALRQLLKPYKFDIAVDLARAGVSRDLLLLTGAQFKYGVGGEDWPWLSSHFIFNTHDRWTNHDMTPHSTKVLALVEALGTLIDTQAPIIRRQDLSRDRLRGYGVLPTDRFAVLHMGARIGFSRWPYHADLVEMILAETDLKVVMISEDAEVRNHLSAEMLANYRVLLLDRRLPFDDFDAFLSFASVMVGNDSGPKHLASLRGTQTVTIFSARINWTEWGQENVGAIISRRIPCAGCAILHEPEDCGKEFACVIDIKPREVFETVLGLLPLAEEFKQ